MKNKFLIWIMICFLTLFTIAYLYFSRNTMTLSYQDNTFFLDLSVNSTLEVIHPFYSATDNCYIFFLPSYSRNLPIILDSTIKGRLYTENSLHIDGPQFTCEENIEYYISNDTNNSHYSIKFLYSENIPSLFLSMENEDLELTLSDKDHIGTTAQLTLINSNGIIEHTDSLEKISTRGNTSWNYAKKPFTFKFHSTTPLCDLEPSREWLLISNWGDASRLQNKVTFDIANIFDLKYTPRGTWIDLYLNGSYMGNYLLCTPISVNESNINIHDLGKENYSLNPNIESSKTYNSTNQKGFLLNNPQNITGGYLIEKDFPGYYDAEASGFITNDNCHFSIKSPKYASREQVDYISNYIQQLENMILTQDPKLFEYLDIDSYSKKFLVDEISMNYDTGVTSCFFYKKRDDDTLYSGPVWDYNLAYGAASTFLDNAKWINPTSSLLDCQLTWNKHLYNNKDFYNIMKDNFIKVLPQLENLIYAQIDSYASTISKSVHLDQIRWQEYSTIPNSYYYGHYQSYQANIEYLKYFLINRINHLISIWNIDYPPLYFDSQGQTHTVTYTLDNQIVNQIKLKHGESIESFPELFKDSVSTWYLHPRIEPYSPCLPVLEDMILSEN